MDIDSFLSRFLRGQNKNSIFSFLRKIRFCFKTHWGTPSSLVSTYVGMWETICDTWACWSGVKFLVQIQGEYPYSEIQNTPPMKIVREAKSEYRIPPKMKIVRVQIREFQNTPPPQKWKLSESPNQRVSEYPPKMKIVRDVQIREFQNTPPNENCQRVQIREFPNNPSPNIKIVQESKSKSFRIPHPPPKFWGKFIFQTSE